MIEILVTCLLINTCISNEINAHSTCIQGNLYIPVETPPSHTHARMGTEHLKMTDDMINNNYGIVRLFSGHLFLL